MARTLPLALLLATLAASADARVVGIEIARRSVVAEGQAFGTVGAYEKLEGRIRCAVRPEDPRNERIVDLSLAPRNAQGEVEFSADFCLLRPKDPARGNGSLLLEIPNRGGKGVLSMMNRAAASLDPETAADFGDGFLMKRGFTVAWVGWQWDVRPEPHRLRLVAPVASQDAKPISGLVRDDFVVGERRTEVPLGHQIGGRIGGLEYDVAEPQSKLNVLTVRDTPLGLRKVIPRKDWSFGEPKAEDGESGRHSIRYEKGFEPGLIYELVYPARDPRVAGLGFAAVRDFVSFLKNAKDSPAPVRFAHGVGISQSGRFLRHFLYEGFNADEEGRRVFDGLVPHVAGSGRGNFNHRFAQPSRDAQPMSAILYATDLFPFADQPFTDPVSARNEGLADRAVAESVAPRIFYTNTSYEYWSRAASLVHTPPGGSSDAPLPANVRVYLYTGLQHFSPSFPAERGSGESRSAYVQSPLPVRWFWRAMLSSLDEWVRNDVAPPASRYPRVADHTLVPLEALAFPKLPGVTLPRDVHQAIATDFGPRFAQGIQDRQPPLAGEPYPALVPQVDSDGNEIAGVRLPQVAVPLATYTGWNLRDASIGAPWARISFLGSSFPFAETEAARGEDPRRSILDRYGDRDRYLGLYAQATLGLVNDGFLLAEDVPAILEHGLAEWDEAVKAAKGPPSSR